MESCQKTTHTSASVNDCMSPYAIVGPPDQSSRNPGNKFRLARPLMRSMLLRSDKKSVKYPCGKILPPTKVGKSGTFVHTPLIFHPKFGDVSLEFDR